MPTSVAASNGVSYHLWQLPVASTPEPTDITAFSSINVPLADGYRASIQTGFDTGTRSWKFRLPTLAHLDVLSNTVENIDGEDVSREYYLWSLYVENKSVDKPFVYLDILENKYFFVDFADETLTFARMKVKLYSVGIELKQRRITGVTLPSP